MQFLPLTYLRFSESDKQNLLFLGKGELGFAARDFDKSGNIDFYWPTNGHNE